jgi:hypothetical protein
MVVVPTWFLTSRKSCSSPRVTASLSSPPEPFSRSSALCH